MLSLYALFFYLSASWLGAILVSKKELSTHNQNSPTHPRSILFFAPPFIIGLALIAFRPFDSGGDTTTYLASFSRINSPFTATSDAFYGSEILFWPTQAILKLFLNERGWLIANYLIIAALSYYAYKIITQETRISPFIFSLIFLTFFAVYSGNAMRQVYSIPLGAIAFHYCQKRKNAKFIIFSALAILFHWSAIIVLIAPLSTRLPNKSIIYITTPIVAFLSSSLIQPIIDSILQLTGFAWLNAKTDLYLHGGRISHIEAVWKTANFWLCLTIYILLTFSGAIKRPAYEAVSKYLLSFISLMLFSINFADISERYMVWFLFLIPIATVMFLERFKANPFVKNSVLAISFLTLGILVFTRESAMQTLGIM